jgi:fatty acid synthase
MDSLMGVEILQVLERDFDLVIASQVLRSLTLSQLEKLVVSKSSVPVDTEISLKIEKLLTSFGDEKNSGEIILKLNKIENGKKVLIVPGFEGMASDVWFEFGKKMKNPAFALQLASTYEEESLEKIFDGVKNVSVFNFSSSIFYSFILLIFFSIASIYSHQIQTSPLLDIPSDRFYR